MTSKTKKSAGGLFIFQHGTREYVAMGSEAGMGAEVGIIVRVGAN